MFVEMGHVSMELAVTIEYYNVPMAAMNSDANSQSAVQQAVIITNFNAPRLPTLRSANIF